MDLESLKTKVTEAGGTQFSALSSRTVDHMLEREIARNSSDEYYTDDVISGIVADLKTMDGNLHFEVGKKNTEYKNSFEEEWKKNHPDTKPTGDDDKFAQILAKMEAQEEKLKEMEDARNEQAKAAKKNEVLESVKRSLKSKFEQAGVEQNNYILRQTLRDIEIPDENPNVSAISKEAETAYYKNLKEAGFDVDKPKFGGNGGGSGNNTPASDFWARKAKKEGWAKK